MHISPLDEWIRRDLGIPAESDIAAALDDYRSEKIRETLAWVLERSPFYRERYTGLDFHRFRGMDDFFPVPFITPEDLKTEGLRMVCVSQQEISRIVTLSTSGTTDLPKRVFLTREDQERTIDFFHHGMMTMTGPGDRVLILMPGERPGSVGDLLSQGLARFGAEGIVHGAVTSLLETWHVITRIRPACLVGLPRQVAALVKYGLREGCPSPGVTSVLLSADYVPAGVADLISRSWGCRVHEHYGLTETCFGGGVTCEALEGYHLREADLFLEILNPDTGRSLPPGETGEIVLTTLLRRGMPLIRYRTGDAGRMLPGPCRCGSSLPRLDRVMGRYTDRFLLRNGSAVCGSMLDDILLPLPEVIDYRMTLSGDPAGDVLTLYIRGEGLRGIEEKIRREIAGTAGKVSIRLVPVSEKEGEETFSGARKGIFQDLRGLKRFT